MKTIFTPAHLGPLKLKNHLVMSPLTRSRAIGNIPNELMVSYYTQRAGAGLIVTEGTSPSPNGLGYARIPGIYSDEQVSAWRKVTDAVHEAGSKIFVQLMHTGRVSYPGNLPKGAEAVAPSAVPLKATKLWHDTDGLQDVPVAREMTLGDVRFAVTEYVQAAKNAVKAGFDGVEIHGANGYLIKQFLNPHTNRRTDEYGGTIENRARFLLEVVTGIIDAIGKDKTGIRLSPFGISNETPIYPDGEAMYDYLSRELNRKEILYIHLVDHSSMSKQPVPDELIEKIRSNFKGAIILSGGYDLNRAESALNDHKGDLIAFGRNFLANPDLVNRYENDLPLNPLRPELFYSSGAEGYTDYPIFENSLAPAGKD